MEQQSAVLPEAGTFYLRDWRKQAGLSQEALAARAGVATATVTRAERRGVGLSRPEVVRKLELALGLEPFGLEKPPPGVPDYQDRAFLDLCFAINTIADAEDLIVQANHSEDLSPEENFLNWVVAWAQKSGELLPEDDPLWWPQGLRYGAAFLEELAATIESRTVASRSDASRQAESD